MAFKFIVRKKSFFFKVQLKFKHLKTCWTGLNFKNESSETEFFLIISGLIDDLSCLLITRAYNYQIIWRGARAELSFEDWSLKLLKKKLWRALERLPRLLFVIINFHLFFCLLLKSRKSRQIAFWANYNLFCLFTVLRKQSRNTIIWEFIENQKSKNQYSEKRGRE